MPRSPTPRSNKIALSPGSLRVPTRSPCDSDSHKESFPTPEYTPCDTPAEAPTSQATQLQIERLPATDMDATKSDEMTTAETVDRDTSGAGAGTGTKAGLKQGKTVQLRGKDKSTKKHKHAKGKHLSKKAKRAAKALAQASPSDSRSSDGGGDGNGSASSESSSSDSDDGTRQRKRRLTQRTIQEVLGLMPKSRRRRRRAHVKSSSDESSESDGSESDDSPDPTPRKSKEQRSGNAKSKRRSTADADPNSREMPDATIDDLAAQVQDLSAQLADMKEAAAEAANSHREKRKSKHKKRRDKKGDSKSEDEASTKKFKRASIVEYKRVDQLWDTNIHNYKLTDTAEDEDADEYDKFIFTVRRQFDWKGKYENTVVNIKSEPLKAALTDVMDGVKGVSLVEDTPSIDPNMLFLYLEDLRTAMKELYRKSKKEKKRKVIKANAQKIHHASVLMRYLDEDYAETKKTLYPLLESGLITFDLLWALYKPNTISYTNTYGNVDEPRAFKVEYASVESSFTRGTWYCVEGRYLEYDGKSFGMGSLEVNVDSFKGARKITSLATYPLKYHKHESAVTQQLIDRGKRFIALQGMNYRFHKGMAFLKKKRCVLKVNINGRVMVDASTFRRINPNYPISSVKPKDQDDEYSDGDSEDDSCRSCDDDAYGDRDLDNAIEGDEDGENSSRDVAVDEDGNPEDGEADDDVIAQEKIEKLQNEDKPEKEFTEEQLLLASPVVLGFAFNEKLWLEFTVSGVKDIEWNDNAFDSLVLPENQKSIVKALVESHTFHAAQNIEDVITHKGRGLVAVLHGPPGTGKTLTAEGIAELLRRPLYMVSAGELGTDPRTLEAELNKLLDLSHSWGAVLLLDEADVFLEKRSIHDIHRNALVSIFLRVLEYFQGILFLTTNRVETFDDAFQSRIHVALRYGELSTKAKRKVWRMFIDRVKAKEGQQLAAFKDDDIESLARKNLNGRQIKNAVRTAQALAINKKERLSMEHIKRVLDVVESFDQELKGGTGYVDAMRSYT